MKTSLHTRQYKFNIIYLITYPWYHINHISDQNAIKLEIYSNTKNKNQKIPRDQGLGKRCLKSPGKEVIITKSTKFQQTILMKVLHEKNKYVTTGIKSI